MHKLFAFFNLVNLKQMVVRFPLPVVVVVVLTLLFLWLNNGNIPYDSATMEGVEKSIVSLMLVFFFSIGVSLAVEPTKLSSVKKSLFQLIPIVF
ncbi:MAG: hypothetical protein LBD75_01340 [Candidatus Peribacteria bacterium]|nr:hypothetical protein [Candidatus Peribacteria bacterium]